MGQFENFINNNLKHYALIKRDFPDEVVHAEQCVEFTLEVIDSIDVYNPVFEHFYSHTVRHLFLGLRSILELQWAELNFNLRQALEGVCVAAYSLICTATELKEFAEKWMDDAVSNQKLMDNTIYKAIETEYPQLNEKIFKIKKQINDNYSHVLAVPTFGRQAEHQETDQGKSTLQFHLCDSPDAFHIKSFLFHIANISLTVVDLILFANDVHQVFSRSKLKQFHALNAENQKIRQTLIAASRM